MAACKVNWILSVLALLSFVLISTVASNGGSENEDQMEKLKLLLRHDSVNNEQVTSVLQQTDPNLEINGIKVAELTGLCEPSLDKCTAQTILRYREIQKEAGKIIPRLDKYTEYCEEYVMKVCFANIDELRRSSSKALSEDNEKLLDTFLDLSKDNYPPSGSDEKEEDSHIREAYRELIKSEYERTGRPVGPEQFLERVKQTTDAYVPLYRFLHLFNRSQEKEQSSLTECYLLSRISFRFSSFVAETIAKEIEERMAKD